MTDTNTYEILKTVQGSRDGLTVTTFTKGEVHAIDASLAEQLEQQGAIRATGKPTSDTAAEDSIEKINRADMAPKADRGIEELVTLARDTHGLNVDSTMSAADIQAAIDAKNTPANDAGEDQEDENDEAGEDEDQKSPAEARRTKVTGPAETKPAKPRARKK